MSKRLFLFGDQSVNCYTCIKRLVRQSKRLWSLRTFLHETHRLLRSRISKLPLSELERFFFFESIHDLAEAYMRSNHNDVVVSSVLLCVAQLGSLLVHVENDPLSLEAGLSSDIYVLGICTGLLPAAIASVVSSVTEILSLGPEIVCVSHELALKATNRSNLLEKSSESWAYSLLGVTKIEVQSEIDAFLVGYNIPSCNIPYVSAELDSAITLSGPPMVLNALFSWSQMLSKAKKIKLPIFAAFHAPHLKYIDPRYLVGPSMFSGVKLRENVHLMSTSSGKIFVANNFRDLLCQIADNILQDTLHWSRTIDAVCSLLGQGNISITAFGPSNATKGVRHALEKNHNQVSETCEIDLTLDDSLKEYSNDIAVVGMSGRFPGGDNLEKFWKIILDGQDLHEKVPKDRFNMENFYDPSGAVENTTMTQYGCFINQPGSFDPRLFNMSPREVAQTDPIQRLLLMTTYEALEMAGYSEEIRSKRKVCTVFGQTTDDWRESNLAQNIDLFYVSGGLRPFGPGRLNYHFKWDGPSYSVDTACSSSATAIEMGCAALIAGSCDIAVCGGGNVMTGPNMFAGLSRGGFLSPSGSCKTFDDHADGYCRGEGVGVVVLKRLEDAKRDLDNIQCIIKSVVTNHSANAVSITHPHSGTQRKLFEQVLLKADMSSQEIGYVEMHGTGTQSGDTAEIDSVATVLGRERTGYNPLYIGSVKANVGHGEAAAGVTSLIKAILMLQKNVIPPHCGVKSRINRNFPPLAEVNIRIASSPCVFEARPLSKGKKNILLNNFNAAGGNTCMLLSDYSQSHRQEPDPRSAHVVTITAATSSSLIKNKENLLKYIMENPETDLASLSYTTTARRIHHVFRTAYSTSRLIDLVKLITNDLAGVQSPSKTISTPSVIFTFPGQGSQFYQMGKQLFETCESFRGNILAYDALCLQQGLPSPLSTIVGNVVEPMTNVQMQLGLVSLELALAFLWQSWGLKPDRVVGHSLGEYAALCFAGVISVTEMLFLVGIRAQIIEKNCTPDTHKMLVVHGSVDILRCLENTEYLPYEVSCVNSPTSTVISGEIKTIDVLKDRLRGHGIKTTLLELPFAFHSQQMDSVVEEFESVARNIKFKKPAVAFVSSLTGTFVDTGDFFTAKYLASQTRHTVNFLGALQACKLDRASNSQIWIECGPGSTSLGFVRSTLNVPSTMTATSIRSDQDCWQSISRGVANAYSGGALISWSEYHREFEHSLCLLNLPPYAFDLQHYWIENKIRKHEDRGEYSTRSSPALTTTCLHSIEKEIIKENEAAVVFVSNIAEPKLSAAINGHLVQGIGLCPSAVYADMALTAASYIQSRIGGLPTNSMLDVASMQISNPLIAQREVSCQLIRISAIKSVGTSYVEVSFTSQGGQTPIKHAQCLIRFIEASDSNIEWEKIAYLVNARSHCIADPIKGSVTNRILQKMIYKIFSSLVIYDKKYQSLEEVFMSCDQHEASAIVKFQAGSASGTFTCNPYWTDCIIHLAGFVLNGGPLCSEDIAYISTGWESLRVTTLSQDAKYSAYVRMQPVEGRKAFSGDVYLFEGPKIVASCVGCKFQEIKRDDLRNLLGFGKTQNGLTQSKSEGALMNIKADSTSSLVTGASRQSENVIKKRKLASEDSDGFISRKRGSRTASSLISKVIGIIATELNVHVSDLSDEVSFYELGVDSLLTISITSKLRAELSLDLPTSMFTSYSTMAELKIFLKNQFTDSHDADIEQIRSSGGSTDTTVSPTPIWSPKNAPPSEDVNIVTSTTATEYSASPRVSPSAPGLINEDPKYLSRSIFLQGNPSSSLPVLFLIADGAGSGASYVNLPQFPSDLPTYALESPFLEAPTEFTCTFEAVARTFLKAVRTIRAQGPYILGGWSMGGMYAYEVTRLLLSEDESVKGLLLIDSPCPKPMPSMQEPTIEALEETGIFISSKTRAGVETPMTLSTKQHLVSSVRALSRYDPIPMDPDRRPCHTFIIWAKDGIFERMNEHSKGSLRSSATDHPDVGSQGAVTSQEPGLRRDWLTARRTCFGPNGWDRLVGDAECYAIDGDHFSIMNQPAILTTGRLMQTALQKILGY